MKKLSLSAALFIASAAYVAYQYVGGSGVAVASTPSTPVAITTTTAQPTNTSFNSPTPVDTTNPASTPTPVTTPTPAPTPAPKPKGQYVDGTYTGNAADAYYGMVQVQVTVQGGKITDVAFLQYPSDRRTSQYINGQAMPQLRQEAIQAQSANVSGVSGASDTSAAFRQSLASALTQAKS